MMADFDDEIGISIEDVDELLILKAVEAEFPLSNCTAHEQWPA